MEVLNRASGARGPTPFDRSNLVGGREVALPQKQRVSDREKTLENIVRQSADKISKVNRRVMCNP